MKHKTRIILAGTLGNLVENFDMAICGLLSVYLAKYLLGDTQKGIFLVFLTFFAGYLARPLGAVLMGLFSDKYGRKIILVISILAMGPATALIGFIPPNNFIGIGSVVLLLFLRILQSFCSGAVYLNFSAYLVENAPPSQKGYIGSWASFGAMSGFLMASLIALVVTNFSNQYPEIEWLLWRIPFVLALLGSSIGLYIRLFIPESLEYIIYYSDKPKPKLTGLLSESIQYIKANKLQSWYVFLLSCLGVTSTFQIYIYGPMQAHLYGHYSDYNIMVSNISSLVVLLCVFPVMGKLSDKINREKIIAAACMGFLILAHPFFNLLSQGSPYQLTLIQALIAIPAGAYYATVPVMLSEMFPLRLRCTVLSVLYSIAASLSAGMAPLLSLILVKSTGMSTSPILLIFSLIACLLVTKGFQSVKNKKRKMQNSPLES